MRSLKTKAALTSRVRKRGFAEGVEFPRCLIAVIIMLIGFMLFLATISNPEGNLRRPGIKKGLFFAAVFAAATGVGCSDSRKWSALKQRFVKITDATVFNEDALPRVTIELLLVRDHLDKEAVVDARKAKNTHATRP